MLTHLFRRVVLKGSPQRIDFHRSAHLGTSLFSVWRERSQKGGVDGFSGCLEPTGVLCQCIQEAMERKDNLSAWLDGTNLYGSIPGYLIYVSMGHYQIPMHTKGLITSYSGDQQSGSKLKKAS